MIKLSCSEWTLDLAVGILACAWLTVLYRSSKTTRFFPSPPGDPIIGHLRSVPPTSQWIRFAEWGKKYGDIIYLSFLGRPAVVLNSANVAHDLMDRRSANFSDRPLPVFHGEMMNWKNLTFALPYGAHLKKQRRYMHEYMNIHAVSALQPLQTEHALSLLKSLLTDPDNFDKHVYRMSAAIIVKLTYGFDVTAEDDELVKQIAVPTSRGAKAGVPCLSPPDLLPVLRHVPAWLPGANFVREAEELRMLTDKVVNEPFDRVKKERALGTAQPSFVCDMLERSEVTNEADEIDMRKAAAMMFGAGVETSEATMLTFFLMMATNERVLKRAQAEIDNVTKKVRLPTLDDRAKLPYINCILKEVFRINPPIPLCIPHQSLEEEHYKEMTIPAKSMVIPNIWFMMRDERCFRDPEVFNPERHLAKAGEIPSDDGLQQFNPSDPSSLVFGFGRRICPGRFLADANMWLAMANILAVFNILPPIDPLTGAEIAPAVEFAGALSNKPRPFKCRLIPRDHEYTSVISQALL